MNAPRELPGISAEDCEISTIYAAATLLEQWSKREHHYSVNVEDTAIGKLTLKQVVERATSMLPRLRKSIRSVEQALYRLEALERKPAATAAQPADMAKRAGRLAERLTGSMRTHRWDGDALNRTVEFLREIAAPAAGATGAAS